MKYVCLLYKGRNLKGVKYIHGLYAEKEREMIGNQSAKVVAELLAMKHFPGLVSIIIKNSFKLNSSS